LHEKPGTTRLCLSHNNAQQHACFTCFACCVFQYCYILYRKCCLLCWSLCCDAVRTFAASLEAKHAGIGLSVFQSISTIVGGFAGPYLFGTVLSQQQDFTQATVLMGCFLGSSGLLAAGLGTAEQWQHRSSSTAVRAIEDS
jgi:hypothetical protein